jgi:hypothetical protein
MKADAPPILSSLDIEGFKNRLMLIEQDDDQDLAEIIPMLRGRTGVVFTSDYQGIYPDGAVVIMLPNIYQIYKAVKMIHCNLDYILIESLDMMDAEYHRQVRGSNFSAYIAMIRSPKLLNGANLIITSANREYNLRGRADVFINMRTNDFPM